MMCPVDMGWRPRRISLETSVRDALAHIDHSAAQFAVVTDREDKLLGVVTDGNIRRGLLAGAEMETPVARVMNATPCVVGPEVTGYLSAATGGTYRRWPETQGDSLT